MKATVDLKVMTVPEKLELLEAVWEDLRRSEPDLPPPEWHGAVLQERAERVRKGEEKPVDWETAKKQLRDELR